MRLDQARQRGEPGEVPRDFPPPLGAKAKAEQTRGRFDVGRDDRVYRRIVG